MGRADLGFLVPLFDLAGSLVGDRDSGDAALGLGEAGQDSALARDDAGLDGMWVSTVITHGIHASLDHALCLRSVVMAAQEVTVNAPWTLARGVLEPASVALWVMDGNGRRARQERALRVWYHDFSERQKWEMDTGVQVVAPAQKGRDRAAAIISTARRLRLNESFVAAKLNYGDSVASAGEAAGWSRAEARARWREASAFAHGRTWPMIRLSSPVGADRIRGGFGLVMALDEARLSEVVRLATDVLLCAIDRYGNLSANGPD